MQRLINSSYIVQEVDISNCLHSPNPKQFGGKSPVAAMKGTLGHHLARRLVQLGVQDVFSVPGDSNLSLLDSIVAEPGLRLVGCCNELNAGYAADGYARARGIGSCIVTFNVGGFSIINAIAGAYSESIPVICIVGGPNSNNYGTNHRILHHTIGLSDFSQEFQCFKTITCFQAVVNNLENARELIDTAISAALKQSKPVYISICCNLVSIPHVTFSREPVPFELAPELSNKAELEDAVATATELLNRAVKPVMVGGPKLRDAGAVDDFVDLADASGFAIAVLPAAKGLVPEHHPRFIGTYWGALSAPFCAEIVESADAYVFVGPVFDDITTFGFSLPLDMKKSVVVEPERVVVAGGTVFVGVRLKDFLRALQERLRRNTTAYANYCRMFVPVRQPPNCQPGEPLRLNVLFTHIQRLLSGDTAVVVDTGDSWFNCQNLSLPQGCSYASQMSYASTGWSVGATLGYAQALNGKKRVIACVGDGSFQMTGQEVSTMLRWGQNSIIFLINNGGYSTEVEIHDGPYNVIRNWNYTAFVDAIQNGEGKCWTMKVTNEEELKKAMDATMGKMKECLCFLEVILHRDDTSKELLQLGSRLALANSRPPKYQ
ncbi:pyruvate decarboxylase 1-like [Zingiber officinale]|uniref:pyruvate decarboxylase 1-like n=1 Tax=Zingiber officinale TaxID=94328 RepID=UPI001C4C4079|nr:pyruvate decarboxylase 1-like [Zingiber officinale]